MISEIIILIIIFIKKEEKFKGSVEIKWLIFKIFYKELNNFHTRDKHKKSDKDLKSDVSKDKDNTEDNKENKNITLKEGKEIISLLRKNSDRIFSFIITSISSIKLEKFDTNVILGLSSPVDTVKIVGSIWAFSAIPNSSKHFKLSAEPVFCTEKVDFESEIIFKIKLLKPAIKLINMLSRKSMIDLILKLRRLFNNA
jgi:hypothetical protein